MKLAFVVFLCTLGVITAAPGNKRPSRSLEEYLPPHHLQHTVPNKLKDYLPPDTAAPIDLKTSAEPCDCDEEPKGYFYPKPGKSFDMPVLRTLDQELPLEEIPEEPIDTTTVLPATTLPERPARSPKKSQLVTDPHDGPVRIRTLPFHITKTESTGRAMKFRRDTNRSQLSKVDAVVVRPAEKKKKTEQKPKV